MAAADTGPARPVTEARIASPWIVAVPNQKGGVGKTTLALALAAVTADANGRALVVDIDPQSSSAEMAGQMEDPGFDFSHEMDPAMLVRLRELRNYDMVFIDCPGSLEGGQILAAVLAVCDFAVIPFTYDPLAARPTVRTARFVAQHGVPYKILLNNIDPRLGRGARGPGSGEYETRAPAERSCRSNRVTDSEVAAARAQGAAPAGRSARRAGEAAPGAEPPARGRGRADHGEHADPRGRRHA